MRVSVDVRAFGKDLWTSEDVVVRKPDSRDGNIVALTELTAAIAEAVRSVTAEWFAKGEPVKGG